MAERNDSRFAEDMRVSFATYCDTNALDANERRRLAAEIGDDLEYEAGEYEDDDS